MNYYEILGVSKSSSSEEIKQAYKKLAKQHHPDRGGDSNFFSQINAAYDVLKDPVKKQEYDNSFQRRYTTTNNFNQNEFDFNFFNDLFEKTFRNYSVHTNRDINVVVSLKLSEVFEAKTVQVSYKTSKGNTETIDVVIPAGIKSGDVIKYRGLGDDADTKFPRGNLCVKIQVLDDPLWKRDNNNLWYKQTIDVFDLLLGCAIIIETLDGNSVKLNIPKGSKTTSIFSIPNHGIPERTTGIRGNIYVQLEVNVPNISDTSTLNVLADIKEKINKEIN